MQSMRYAGRISPLTSIALLTKHPGTVLILFPVSSFLLDIDAEARIGMLQVSYHGIRRKRCAFRKGQRQGPAKGVREEGREGLVAPDPTLLLRVSA